MDTAGGEEQDRRRTRSGTGMRFLRRGATNKSTHGINDDTRIPVSLDYADTDDRRTGYGYMDPLDPPCPKCVEVRQALPQGLVFVLQSHLNATPSIANQARIANAAAESPVRIEAYTLLGSPIDCSYGKCGDRSKFPARIAEITRIRILLFGGPR